VIPNIKKAVIYFDDGTTGSGSGSGFGSGASGNIKRKIGNDLIFCYNFVFFQEENREYQAIPSSRIVRIIILLREVD